MLQITINPVWHKMLL